MSTDHVLTAVAWPYANGPRHIGHVAGFGVPSDVFSRYQRMAGHRVLMVSGTDEHGTPILVQADQEGVTPRQAVDRYSRMIAEDLQKLGLSYDLFTRTTTGNHYAVVQEMFLGLFKNGYVFPQVQLGAISPSTGRTLPDRYIEGICPICGYPHARGDQCDNCGNQLDPSDLIEPRSRINGETPLFVETEQYFLDLGAFTGVLGDWLQKQTHWRPNVRRFTLNLLNDLKPRAITRDLDWGVPVPLEGWRDRPDKKLYVWFDAVIGYLSASIEWAARTGDPDAWRPFWQSPDARGYYFMGKDNIVFHAEIWPAILFGYSGRGDRGGTPGSYGALEVPYEVVSSEFLQMEGRKFSSSRNVVIYVRDMLSRYDPDALRYYLAVAGPETQDTDFTWAEFLRRNNDELVAGLGQPGEPHDRDDRQEPRGYPGRGRAHRRRSRAAGHDTRSVRHRRRPALPVSAAGRDHRGHARGRRGEQVPVGDRALEAPHGGSGPDGYRAARRAAGGRRLQDAADPVPAVVVLPGSRATGRNGNLGRDARSRCGRGPDRRGRCG